MEVRSDSSLQWTNVNEALVWVYRLRQLARYWQARTAADARHGLGSDINGDAFGRICSQTRGGKEIIKDPSPTGQDAFLNLVYNWSIITGSRYYTLSGSVYIKDERRTQYVRRHCIIVKGHLFFYKVHPFRYSTKSTQHIWHPIKSHWDLNDSYVISQGALCSGWNVATDDLDYKPGEHFGPRVYADGLRSADEDEDCSLAIWKRLNPSDLSKKAKGPSIALLNNAERQTSADPIYFRSPDHSLSQ